MCLFVDNLIWDMTVDNCWYSRQIFLLHPPKCIRLEGVTPSQLAQSILRHGTKFGAEAFNLVLNSGLNGYHSFLITADFVLDNDFY